MGKFWTALDMKTLVYFMATWNILRPFGIVCDHCVHFSRFGVMYQVKSGNLDSKAFVKERKRIGAHRLDNQKDCLHHGCQIFHDTIYQNEAKYTKLPQHYQMAIKYIK
jgi:hypothetical protein